MIESRAVTPLSRSGTVDQVTGDLPAPPLSPDVDLSDYRFMPVDVVQLRDSRWVDVVTGEEFRAGMLLQCSAWHQVPAASLPDDDLQLAKLAGYGRSLDAWNAVRTGALYGFVKASDGRLYHPVLVEKALAAWAGKRKASVKGKAGALKRWANRDATATDIDGAGNATAIARAIPGDSNGERDGEGERKGEKKHARARAKSHPRLLSDQHAALLLKSNFSAPEIEQWFLPCEFAFDGEVLAILAPSEFSARWIQDKFDLRLKKVFGAKACVVGERRAA